MLFSLESGDGVRHSIGINVFIVPVFQALPAIFVFAVFLSRTASVHGVL